MVVVIVEDDHHKMLIYRYLLRNGLSSHQITIKLSPSGKGSAEQWIRTAYASEVKAYRIRQAKAATALIVIIDADTKTVQERVAQLSRTLDEEGLPEIENQEQIALLIPKRNVETWILCLTEQTVDEATDYKRNKHDWQELIPHAAERLFQWTRPNAALPYNCIDSLRNGVRALNRLEF